MALVCCPISKTFTRNQLEHLQLEVIGGFGAGYYSFGAEKEFYHIRCRASLGSLLAILFSLQRPEFAQATAFLKAKA
jgi:hypothetical protein